MNKTKIEWCDYTWNPIVGCQNGCSWCWARRMNKRFGMIKNFEDPRFFPSRLTEPEKLSKHSVIAVCLMGDIFSPGVESDWIDLVMYSIRKMDHTFMLLTKFPQRFMDFAIPPNCWLGTSISSNEDAHRVDFLSSMTCKYTKFVSIEPLLGMVDQVNLAEIDHVYVGAQTGAKRVIPQKEWIASIRHHSILFKNNIKPYL
jgi:protein gp37